MKNDSMFFRDRKATQSSRRNQIDFDQSARFNTSTSVINTNLEGSNHSELTKIIISLEKSLKEQKQKKLEAEDRLLQHIKRADERQKQFHAILANASSSVYMQVSGDTNIQKLHKKLMGKVAESEQKMREKFELRYKQNVTIMDRKIKSIIELMETQLKKASTLSEMQHGQLKTNINRLEVVALEIDLCNTQLMKANAELEFKVKLLKEEKSLLIQELNEKKTMCKKYYSRAQMYSREGSRAHSEVGNDRQGETSRNNTSNSKRKQLHKASNKNTLENSSSNAFALELIKSKMFAEEGTSSNELARLHLTHSTNVKMPSKKEYISTMTIGSMNPEMHAKIMTETSRHRNKSPYLLTKAANSYNSTLVNSTIKPLHSSKPMTPHHPQTNTIASLRNIIARQKQKRLDYQSKLTQIQQKIITIDKIVVDALILVKGKQQNHQSQLMSNKVFKKMNQNKIQEQQLLEKSEMFVLKSICDKIKNIINGSLQGMIIKPLEINLNHMTLNSDRINYNEQQNNQVNQMLIDESQQRSRLNNQELLQLLKAV